MFEEVDEDGDGKLNEEELGIAIDRLIGYKPSINILKQLILASDKCKSGKIEFPEFFALVRSWSFLSDSEKNARKAFAVMFSFHFILSTTYESFLFAGFR